MKIFFFTLSLISFNFFTYAQNTRSEFFYQAGADEKFIQGNLNYFQHTTKIDGGNKLEMSDLDLKAAFEMGMSEMLSVYGNLGYGIGKIEVGPSTTDLAGIDPLNLGVKIQNSVGPGKFFGRANLGLGILSKRDCNSDQECNRTDGSIDLSLRVGYLNYLDDSTMIGFAFDMGLFSTDGKNKDNNSSSEFKSGFRLNGFYEKLYVDMLLGGAVSLTMAGFDGGIIETGLSKAGPFRLEDMPMKATFLGLKGYSRIPMTEVLDLLGSINFDYALSHSNDGGAIKSGMNVGANIGVRMSL